MAATNHDNYADDLLSALVGDHPMSDGISFRADRGRIDNAAGAMTAIVCNRLLNSAKNPPIRQHDKTYGWKEGIFACRSITDRGYLWTNIRRNLAEAMHHAAANKSAVYFMACTSPPDATVSAWAVPEPLIYDSLLHLPVKKTGGYSIEIRTDRQRLERYAEFPDFSRFFRRFPLSRWELQLLQECRAVDASAKHDRKAHSISKVEDNLAETGAFDPEGVRDARERVLSAIVRRRGQPAFRQRLLAAYNGQCAITGCKLEAVLEAAHIVPYQGPETNHPHNGLLLRADLHTLFDLKLITIDAATMSVRISPQLAGSCYEEYGGKRIHLPADLNNRPSRKALRQHQQKSGF
jgi:hypothetical protein